jgi:hypothetical protein
MQQSFKKNHSSVPHWSVVVPGGGWSLSGPSVAPPRLELANTIAPPPAATR